MLDLEQSGFGVCLTKNHLCKRSVFLKPHPEHVAETDPHINVLQSNWNIYSHNFMNFSNVKESDHLILQTYHPHAELIFSSIKQ